MTYIKKSVPRSGGISPGSPVPKDPNVTIIDADDILTSPERDSKGVKMVGNFVLNAGASMIQVYMTPKKQAPTYTGDGEVDELVITQNFEGSHPGDSLEINEFIQNWIGKDIILIYGSCSDNVKKVYGTKCSPMRLKPSFEGNDTKTGHTLAFEQSLGTGYLPGHYEGTLSFADPTDVADENVTLSVANGYRYQLAAAALTAALNFTITDLEHGDVVTLIGGGGTDPYTLAAGAAGDATVVLKDGVTWTALDNATIDLMVYKSGATTYLIEQKRG